MKTVGTYEAKTHLPRLLAEVERGERITITRRGKPIAVISPIEEIDRARVKAAIESIDRLRKGNRLDGLSIKEMIEEGRP